MDQDSGPAGTEHDFHFSGGSFAGVELKNRLSRGFFGEVLGSLLAEEEIERDSASATGAATGRIPFGLGNAGDVQAGKRLRVIGKCSIRADHKNAP